MSTVNPNVPTPASDKPSLLKKAGDTVSGLLHDAANAIDSLGETAVSDAGKVEAALSHDAAAILAYLRTNGPTIAATISAQAKAVIDAQAAVMTQRIEQLVLAELATVAAKASAVAAAGAVTA